MKKSKSMKIFTRSLLVLFTMSITLTGCGTAKVPNEDAVSVAPTTVTTETATTSVDISKPVKLKWYIDNTPGQDARMAEVLTEANKIIQSKINATLDLQVIDYGSYDQKMQMKIASGEEFDLCFTANWANNYYTNVNKGAFVEVSDLVKNYAPDATAQVPQMAFDAFKVSGKAYAVPAYQIYARALGVSFLKEYTDKYKLDVTNVKKLEDLSPFFEAVHKDNPQLNLIMTYKDPLLMSVLPAYSFEAIADANVPGAIDWSDNSGKITVINQFDTDKFKSYLKLRRDWYQKGYIRKDAATLADSSADAMSGKLIGRIDGTFKPNQEQQVKASFNNKDVIDLLLSTPYVATSNIVMTGTGISKSSKNPERAMMMYNLLFADKDLFRMLTNGIEGKDYTKVDADTIELIPNSGYMGIPNWEAANNFNDFIIKGMAKDTWDQYKKFNDTAQKSPILGFAFNPEPVKSELAKCSSVAQEFLPALCSGAIDPDKQFPTYLAKVKEAGADKIIAEEQKQLEEWAKANGK